MNGEVRAAQVYTILQTGRGRRAEEIAQVLGGEPGSVERCLRLLADLGLLHYDSDGRFTVAHPETGMSILLSRAQAQLAPPPAGTPGPAAPDGPASAAANAGTAISAREWQVLQLLAQGCTDEMVARNLDVSLRTVRRVTADLMNRLGARSRFQAGLKASRLLAERPADRPARLRPLHVRSHRLPEAQRRHPAIAAAG
ncbi:helix-turn-helix domain-containing protein [Nonomuraea gerenzanensis]|uniref:Regulatory protein, LuxR n=1 Tax=Nonomuraea gerenzanensis TaxID=93944 RepID=A0A1M4BL23_9ACTN|nr:helix-turn-helix domain-containing protein [Nonomuraea gerenzanensis]UBU19177.1 helix-turn-helix domain-containing protein [Nonomuraea gerenzanensis]SAP16376.1 regulatory protein, LuxR [Nonomuraea gerenzanensis]